MADEPPSSDVCQGRNIVSHIAWENKQCSKPEAAAMSEGLNVAAGTPAAVGAGQRDALRQCRVVKGAGECDRTLQLEDKSSLALAKE